MSERAGRVLLPMFDAVPPPSLPDALPPVNLLDLLPELITHILKLASPSTCASFACCSSAAHILGSADEIWQAHMNRVYPDHVKRTTESDLAAILGGPIPPKQDFLRLACGEGWSRPKYKFCKMFCPCQPGCGGELVMPSGRRCSCVCVRNGRRLPLRVGTLSAARAGSSCFREGGFRTMNQCLRTHFGFEDVEELSTLEPHGLAPLDVLLVCTTEGPPLSDAELLCLRGWVEAGGALITSAFSNWSAQGHYAQSTVGWLGLQTVPHERFGPQVQHKITPRSRGGTPQPYTHAQSVHGDLATASDDETARLVVAGPFGGVPTLPNLGETLYSVLDAAFERGAVQLTSEYRGRQLLRDRKAALMFYPPRSIDAGGVTGRGRVLVCSNYHWLADKHHWNGGLFTDSESRPSKLLLNFVAATVAARADTE